MYIVHCTAFRLSDGIIILYICLYLYNIHVACTFYVFFSQKYISFICWCHSRKPSLPLRDETLEALSDAQIVAPAAQTVDLQSANHRSSYLYVFDYQTKNGDFPQVRTFESQLTFSCICISPANFISIKFRCQSRWNSFVCVLNRNLLRLNLSFSLIQFHY